MRCKELTLYILVWVNAYSSYSSLYITQDAGKGNLFDPLHPNNSIYILNTDLSTFPGLGQGEFVWQSGASNIGDYFYYIIITLIFDSRVIS